MNNPLLCLLLSCIVLSALMLSLVNLCTLCVEVLFLPGQLLQMTGHVLSTNLPWESGTVDDIHLSLLKRQLQTCIHPLISRTANITFKHYDTSLALDFVDWPIE
jgi:hypothetical protein